MPLPGFARTLPLCLGLTLTSLTPAHAFELFLGSPELPEVLTATRLKQAPAAVPGSISVLDRDLIRASGAREITELLRLVPGLIVVPDDIKVQVNYHGGHAPQARRMQVLIDGRSVYRPGLAEVDWKDLPVSLEDIERIEVFRGPNTVSYGANALTGVINIITLKPHEALGTQVRYTHGQRGIRDSYASHGFGWTQGALRFSLSSREDTGFDHRSDGSPYHDDISVQRFNLRATHELSDNQSLDGQLAFADGTHDDRNRHQPIKGVELLPGEQDELTERKNRSYAGSLRWNWDINPNHSLYVQGSLQHWERIWERRACDAVALFSPALRSLYRGDPSYSNQLLTALLKGDPIPAGTLEQEN
ncbi:MAG TPA: TonB-dependent receptor plug domain-containing protein, partial [Pseudomonas sp.]|nr:TonB-dependent receptor plug domain-containing protein [Pseudomonas sp.]